MAYSYRRRLDMLGVEMVLAFVTSAGVDEFAMRAQLAWQWSVGCYWGSWKLSKPLVKNALRNECQDVNGVRLGEATHALSNFARCMLRLACNNLKNSLSFSCTFDELVFAIIGWQNTHHLDIGDLYFEFFVRCNIILLGFRIWMTSALGAGDNSGMRLASGRWCWCKWSFSRLLVVER